MGFYELGNGCDSCDTISSAVPTNINMQMDPNSAMIASMGMNYGAQANTVQQYNNSMSSSGYAQGGSMGSMGMGSNGSTMGARQQQQPAQQVVVTTMPVANANQPKVVKQVVTTTTTTPVAPAAAAAQSYGKVEGFTDGSHDGGLMSNDKKWIVLGLVIFSALSLNECCKYFLNKSLQLNDGSPMYYFAYAVVAILLTIAANKYASS
jgi:hypothetical protein